MTRTNQTTRPLRACLLSVAVVGAAITLLLLGPTPGSPRATAATSCPTMAEGPSVTAAPCTSSTLGGGNEHIAVTVNYANGVVKWSACGFAASATGTTVQLYLDGTQVTVPGGTAGVGSNGCAGHSAADATEGVVQQCLQPGNHTATAVDSAANAHGSVDFKVSSAGITCAAGASHGGGSLAFTGSNIQKLVLAAIVAIVLGYIVVRLNRQRRQAR